MNRANGSPGAGKLGEVIQRRISESTASPLVLDFGQIQNDYSLLTNTFPIPIPQADYLVCRNVTHDPTTKLTTTASGQGNHPHGSSGTHGGHDSGNGEHSHPEIEGAHVHDVVLPSSMRWLQPGDRVLVAWVQNDAVVIDIVRPATEIGG